jgi:hypothetical protein
METILSHWDCEIKYADALDLEKESHRNLFIQIHKEFSYLFRDNNFAIVDITQKR